MDNLIELESLKARIITADLFDRTVRCGLIWHKIGDTVFTCTFYWNGIRYDVYISNLQRQFVLDFLQNGRNILSVNSYINSDVEALYLEIEDILDESAVELILQDLNTLENCQAHNIVVADLEGGVVCGGVSDVNTTRIYFDVGSGGAVAGGTVSSQALEIVTYQLVQETVPSGFFGFDSTNQTLFAFGILSDRNGGIATYDTFDGTSTLPVVIDVENIGYLSQDNTTWDGAATEPTIESLEDILFVRIAIPYENDGSFNEHAILRIFAGLSLTSGQQIMKVSVYDADHDAPWPADYAEALSLYTAITDSVWTFAYFPPESYGRQSQYPVTVECQQILDYVMNLSGWTSGDHMLLFLNPYHDTPPVLESPITFTGVTESDMEISRFVGTTPSLMYNYTDGNSSNYTFLNDAIPNFSDTNGVVIQSSAYGTQFFGGTAGGYLPHELYCYIGGDCPEKIVSSILGGVASITIKMQLQLKEPVTNSNLNPPFLVWAIYSFLRTNTLNQKQLARNFSGGVLVDTTNTQYFSSDNMMIFTSTVDAQYCFQDSSFWNNEERFFVLNLEFHENDADRWWAYYKIYAINIEVEFSF